jgi:phosphate transport system substrate-binding protein
MWRQQKKDSPIVNLALLLTLATIPTAATLLVPAPMLAKSPAAVPAFPLPPSVPNGTTVRIDSSDSLGEINQGLKQSFEQQFSGTKVEVTSSGTDSALKALQDGKVDLVALSRGLTKEEKAQGLAQVLLRREKIAIVVGAGNPFQGSLTNKQFLKIFRGEITDWSELGAPKGKIRVIDRPTTSDARQNLRNYPAFKTTNFVTGANATQLPEDNTAEIVKQLGNDGISYGLATQFSKLENVRVLQINQAALDDAKYPFSQPLVYVYKKKPNPGVAAFLGFAIASPGQTAIDVARTAQAQAIATATTPSPVAQSIIAATPSPIAEATTTPTVSPSEQPAAMMSAQNNASAIKPTLFLWLLLPVIGGLLLWFFLRKGSSIDAETDNVAESTSSPVTEDGTFAHTDSNLDTGTNLTPSNTVENLSSAASSVTTDGVVRNPKTESIVNNDTNNHSNSAVTITPESGETTWDIEAPASIVNTSYPQLPDVPIIQSNVELPATELPTSNPELTNLPEVASHTDNWSIESIQEPKPELPQNQGNIPENTTSTTGAVLAGGAAIAAGAAISSAASETGSDIQANNETIQDSNFTELDSPKLPEITVPAELPTVDASNAVAELPEITVPAELPTVDASNAVAELPELPEVALNAVADAAEPTTNFTEDDTVEIVSNLPAETNEGISNVPAALATGAALAAGAGASIYGIQNASESDAQAEHEEIATSIVLTPESPTSVHVAWQISDTEKLSLRNFGISKLSLRLYDVTGIDLSYQVPPLVQHYELDSVTQDRSVAIPNSDREYITEIGYVTPGDRWESIARSATVRVFSHPVVETATTDSPHEETTTNIILTPESPESVHVAWQISDTEKLSLRNFGISKLSLRLYDVTGIDLSYQVPDLVQHYELDSATQDRSVAIPTSDREYITEIGYVTPGDRWESIARSSTVRVFSHPGVETATDDSPHEEITTNIVLTSRTPKWAYVAWQISDTQKQDLQNSGVSQLALRLYDVTGIDLSYQSPHLVQHYELDSVTHDRFVAIPTSDREYITEIGYATSGDRWESIARSSTVRIFSHPQTDFWFVADAELIIHGATEPNATVTIGQHTINLKPDGTFHLRIPFSESLIEYLITAAAADGGHAKTIHKKFSQETPEA